MEFDIFQRIGNDPTFRIFIDIFAISERRIARKWIQFWDIKISKSKVLISQKIRLGERRHFPFQITFESQPDLSRNISNLAAQLHVHTRAWTSIRFVTIRSRSRKSFLLLFFSFFRARCLTWVGRNERPTPTGRYRHYPPARSYEPFIGW